MLLYKIHCPVVAVSLLSRGNLRIIKGWGGGGGGGGGSQEPMYGYRIKVIYVAKLKS